MTTSTPISPKPLATRVPRGWYQDPADPTRVRWFDGQAWSRRTDAPDRVRRRRSAAWWTFAGCVGVTLFCWMALPFLVMGTDPCSSDPASPAWCDTLAVATGWMFLLSPLPAIVSFVVAVRSRRSTASPWLAPLIGAAVAALPLGAMVIAVVAAS